MGFRSFYDRPFFNFIHHVINSDTAIGHFLKNLFGKIFGEPEPEPEPEPEAPAHLDLSSLDALIGTNGDDVDEATIQDESGDDYTAFMYEQGLLSSITDSNGIITGFEFTTPEDVALDVTGTIGGDDITTNIGDNTLNGRDGDDTLSAGEGNDSLHGGNGEDTLYGDAGNDMLFGDMDSDVLYGGAGDDTLNGGAGIDNLLGGDGADTFLFTADSALTGADFIRDFDAAEGDVIDISDLLSAYDPLTDAITDFVQITDNGTNTFVAVDVDGGGDNFQNVAVVTNTTGMTDEDLQVNEGTLIV